MSTTCPPKDDLALITPTPDQFERLTATWRDLCTKAGVPVAPIVIGGADDSYACVAPYPRPHLHIAPDLAAAPRSAWRWVLAHEVAHIALGHVRSRKAFVMDLLGGLNAAVLVVMTALLALRIVRPTAAGLNVPDALLNVDVPGAVFGIGMALFSLASIAAWSRRVESRADRYAAQVLGVPIVPETFDWLISDESVFARIWHPWRSQPSWRRRYAGQIKVDWRR